MKHVYKIKILERATKLSFALALYLSTFIIETNLAKGQIFNFQLFFLNISQYDWYLVWEKSLNRTEYFELTMTIAFSLHKIANTLIFLFQNYFFTSLFSLHK